MTPWQKLCEAVRVYTSRPIKNCPFTDEHTFEDHFSEYLRYIFGWKLAEIGRQDNVKFDNLTPIQANNNPTVNHHIANDQSNELKSSHKTNVNTVKSANKRTDLILYQNQTPTIVIELKAFGQPLGASQINQLAGYMQHLPTRIGILTNGAALQLYYQPQQSQHERNKPRKVLTLRFDSDNPDGEQLGQLLNRENYDEQAIYDFCQNLADRRTAADTYPYDHSTAFASITLSDHNQNPSERLQYISEQITRDLDDKILTMIDLYRNWLQNTPQEQTYVTNYQNGMAWVREYVFNVPNLPSFTDADYRDLIHRTPSHLYNLKNGANRTLYTGLDGSRKTFINAIKFLNSLPDRERFTALQTILDRPEYKIRGIGKSFWSEIIRCKFPDIPLVNSKTNDFFIALGLDIGVTPEEQTLSVAYCYNRWNHLYSQLKHQETNIFELSHMEHFAKESKIGQKFTEDNFGTIVGRYY